jgi:aminopeptidase N
MTRKIFILFSLQLSICTLFGQNITGNWYEIESSRSSLEIIIEENNNTYFGSFTWEWKNWINTVNTPLDKVSIKNDSLFLEFTHANRVVNYNLQWKDSTNTYQGLFYINSRQIGTVTLSRMPIERDLTISPVVEKSPTRQDTLRGKITPERAWWDLTHYSLDFELDIENKYIKGSNTLRYMVLDSGSVMQIDMQPPLKITKVQQDDKSLTFTQEGNAYFIELDQDQIKGSSKEIEVFYEGSPQADSKKGIIWKTDKRNKPLIYSTCQGDGASLWWPCKDHMYAEPEEGMNINVTVPTQLTAVANGRLISTQKNDNGTTTYEWKVVNPINNYGVSLNVADYTHFSDPYMGKNGKLDCDYYVLPDDLEKAKEHFKQAHLMLEAFEHWFGPYPFYEDGYKLVEGTGMEHQSSIGYSGGYINGMKGFDYTGSGWGLKFDYLIIHESGHEWFANNITYKDMADMWLHEGFTAYSEALYVEYHFGKEAGDAYIKGVSRNIQNDKPIIGDYDINDDDYSIDVYDKGATLLHTLRQVINDDEKWRSILSGLNTEFFHTTVTSKEIENYIAQQSGLDLKPFFDQYLRTTDIPILEYYFEDNKILYRWINAVSGFNMPVKVIFDNQEQWIQPKTSWTHQYRKGVKNELTIDPNFYIAGFKNMK